jgi:hypothetical protein
MRRNRTSQCLFGIFFLLLLANTICAQTAPAPTPTPSLESEFFKNILRDQKAIWLAPITLRKTDAKWVVPWSVGTMALITTDRITGDEIAEFDHLDRVSKIVSVPGSAYGITALAGSFYLAGRKHRDDRERETAILIAEASVDSVIAVSALKLASQRGRPRSGIERSEFFDGGSSFPSGHSAQAWAAATIVASEYQDKRLVQIAAYGLASAVSVARFTAGKHYLSDVLAGSAIGFGIGKYVYRTHHRSTISSDDTSLWPAITPQFNRAARQYGIALTWSF